jgi:hypothetical protein
LGGSDTGRSRYTGHRSGPGGLTCVEKVKDTTIIKYGQIFGSFLGFIIVGHLYYTGSSLVAAKTLESRKMLAQYDVLVLGATGFTGQVRSMSSNMPLPKLNNLYKSL